MPSHARKTKAELCDEVARLEARVRTLERAKGPDLGAELAGLLDLAGEAVIVLDRDRRIRMFNHGARRLFGYGMREAGGMPVEKILPRLFAPTVVGDRREVIARRKDGSEFPVEASTAPSGGTLPGMTIVVLRDITESKLAEEKILAAKVDAELANRAKSEFLANMSHELRTPLNAVIGFAEIIESETLGALGCPEYRDHARSIKVSGHHLLKLIDDILELSKIEAGKVELNEDDVDVLETVRSSLMLMGGRAHRAGLTLVQDTPGSLPQLRADERMLKQILVHLLSNAVKFTPAGGTVTLKAWYRATDGYVFQISDTGIGMTLEDIPKAMIRFGQIESQINRRFDGTGLGLPLTKSLIELHSGSIDLQSKVGLGTTVTVRFPAERIVLTREEPGLGQPVELSAGDALRRSAAAGSR